MTHVSRTISVLGMTVMLVITAGCSEQGERLNAPPQGDTDRPSELNKDFIYMADNAMLHDSSIADSHFEPHSAYLNGLGIRRLVRMGELLTVTGGTIYYETPLRDQDLIDRRLATVREFLTESGFDTERVLVDAGLSKGHGMAAVDAIAIQHEFDEADATADAGGGLVQP